MYGRKGYIMDSKDTLMMFDTPGKNCPLNILAPVYKKLPGGGCILHLSNTITFFCYVLKE